MLSNTTMANIGRFKMDKDCETIISGVQDFNGDYIKMISRVQRLLIENTEWFYRYTEYAEKINKNLKTIRENKQKFHEWSPLYLYMNVTAAKGQGIFSLRYLGQDVAKLKVAPGKITVSTKGFDDNNKLFFGCLIELVDDEWQSDKAASFRRYFSSPDGVVGKVKKRNEEHRIESMFLTEFEKKKSIDKILCNIQPVKIAGIARFQMPTPISASDINNVKFVGPAGGGIDIMSRIGTGSSTKLCIMELKDENVSKEPPTKAILQGLAYAVFIRELLRSKSGEEWWKIFGFSGKLPAQLELYVTCVMPTSVKNNDMSFGGKIIETGKDSFNLNYVYFVEKNKIKSTETSLKQCIVKTHKAQLL